jgi:prophage regulatory protein
MSEAVVRAEKTSMPKVRRFLRLQEVIETTGLSRTTIYRMIAKGGFPPPIKLSERAVGWKDSDVFAWMDERERLSRHSMKAL